MSAQAPRPTAEEPARATDLLREAPFAYVAMVDGARPYVLPMNFAYVATAAPAQGASCPVGRLHLHTGPGRKSVALADNPRVCVVVTADATFDQGATPCDDGFAFRSVIVEGPATLLEDRTEREEALRTILAKYDPGRADTPFDPDVLAQTLVYAVTVETITYKELRPRGAD